MTGKRFQCYLNPERTVEEAALAVHGLTQPFLEDKPLFSTIAAEFIAFLEGAELIIHNAPFDVGFITPIASASKNRRKSYRRQ